MILGTLYVVQEAKRKDQDQDRYLLGLLISLTAAAVGAHLFYVIFSWKLYRADLMAVFNLRSGGYAFYGGLLGGFLAAYIFCRILKISFGEMADTAVPGILIGQTVGRWGDFFNRTSFGDHTDSLFAMELPLSAVRSSEVTSAMRENLIIRDGTSFISVHPVFLYESAWCLFLFWLFLIMRRKKKFQGELFMLYLAGYGLGRFFFEYLRTDSLMIPGTAIRISLVISAVLFIVFLPVAWIKRFMAKKRAAIRKKSREKNMKDRFLRRQDTDRTFNTEEKKDFESEESTDTENKDTEDIDRNSSTEGDAAIFFKESDIDEEWEKSEYAHIGRPNTEKKV